MRPVLAGLHEGCSGERRAHESDTWMNSPSLRRKNINPFSRDARNAVSVLDD